MNSTQSMKHNHVGMGYSNKGMKLIKKVQLITFGTYAVTYRIKSNIFSIPSLSKFGSDIPIDAWE